MPYNALSLDPLMFINFAVSCILHTPPIFSLSIHKDKILYPDIPTKLLCLDWHEQKLPFHHIYILISKIKIRWHNIFCSAD